MQEYKARQKYKQVIGKSLKRIDTTIKEINEISFEELRKMYGMQIMYKFAYISVKFYGLHPSDLEKVIRENS